MQSSKQCIIESLPMGHTFKLIEVECDPINLQAYLSLGMIEEVRDPEDNLKFASIEVWSKMMSVKKHIPPARGDEGIISLIYRSLFVMNPCV
jgi:hypothetical protein